MMYVTFVTARDPDRLAAHPHARRDLRQLAAHPRPHHGWLRSVGGAHVGWERPLTTFVSSTQLLLGESTARGLCSARSGTARD